MANNKVFYTCRYDEDGVASGADRVYDAESWVPRKNGVKRANAPQNVMPSYIARVGYYIGVGVTRSEARANARYCMRFTQAGNLEVSSGLMTRWINNEFAYADARYGVACSGEGQCRESTQAVYLKKVYQSEW